MVSQHHFLHYFWRKVFLKLHSINWPNFTVPLPLLFKILGSMSIAVTCCSTCNDINFEINRSFLIKLHDQNVWTKVYKYLENEKNLNEITIFSSYLKGFHESRPLTFNNLTYLKRLTTFFILILLHTVSKISMWDLLYTDLLTWNVEAN